VSTVEASVYSVACPCPKRSRTLPMTADLTSEGQGGSFACHWVDGVGWELCMSNESSYELASEYARQTGDPVEPFDEWWARAQATAAEANEDRVEKWRGVYLRELGRQVTLGEQMVVQRQYDLTEAIDRLRLDRCRLAAAELVDREHMEAANRLLDGFGAGSPEQLVECAEAVLS